MAKAYLVTYDLNEPGQNYEKVTDCIRNKLANNGIWCKVTESSYLIRTSLTTSQMQDIMSKYTDKSDSFLIIEVNNDYSGWINKDLWPYIRENIFRNY